jgi:uncharacterized protein
MNKRDAIKVLRRHEADLRARGIVHAALFGSVDSDIDIMIEFAPDTSLDIFAYVELKDFIESLFPSPVDVVNKAALKPHVRPPAVADSIYAF